MSVSPTAISIIGIKLHRSQLVKQTVDEIRGCNCNTHDSKFCSECGSPLHVMQHGEKVIDGVQPKYEGDLSEFRLDGYDIYRAEDMNGELGHFVVIKKIDSSWEDNAEMIPLDDDLIHEKQQLKSKLQPLGLWNEQLYGLWSLCLAS